MGRLSRGRDGKIIVSWQVDGSFIKDLEFGKHSLRNDIWETIEYMVRRSKITVGKMN